MNRVIALCAFLGLAGTAHAEDLFVDPEQGNSTFTAVFDAQLGERITANSSNVKCDISLDEKTNTALGTCSVALTSVRVDNDDTKTDHFRQWVTNKKSEPKACRFEATFTGAKLSGPLVAEQPVKFSADVPFTVCGRKPEGAATEHLEGTAVLFPPGSYGTSKTIRIRARIEKFNRDRYRIGPKYTDGWLARVQSLAKVVAEEGQIDLNLFARPKAK
jgi:hypothetical protein